MREIKFRAWHTIEQIMCEVTNINFENNAYFLKGITETQYMETETTIYPASEGGRAVDIVEIRLMQYLGLKDENKKKVYEGDIVLIDHWKSQDLFDYKNPFEVCYGYGQVYFKQGNYPLFIGSLAGKIKIIVIGNIYENPELF